jgi:hypothetical protein
MTKKALENLRNENRDKFVQVCHNVARLFEEWAERVKEGGLLTENDWKVMNKTEFVNIPCHEEDMPSVFITYLFTNSVDSDTDIVESE